MRQALLVFLGSGIGGVLRWLTSQLAAKAVGTAFPYGTITVNVVGSFIIVMVIELSLKTTSISPDTRLFLTTGCMGGLTTYSTFNYETIKFFQETAPFFGVLNIVVTVALCLGAGGLGLLTARAIAGT